MLFTDSPRSRLFDRVGLTEIHHRPVTLAPEFLAMEKANEIGFLQSAVDDLHLR
jgi:hypothetical protein